MKKIAAILILILSLSLLSACGSTGASTPTATEPPAVDVPPVALNEEPAEDSVVPVAIDTLRIAFSPYADADTITASTQPLTDLLKASLLDKGYDVANIEMTVGTSYPAVGEALSAGAADIGFISSANYILYSDDCDVLVTALRKAINKDSLNPADWNDGTIEAYTDNFSTYYRCIILAGSSAKGRELAAKVNNGDKLTWDDLNSATWAVLSPTSSSGYIYPCLWLQNNYGKGIGDLSNVVEVESHTSAVARLASEQVDIMVSYGHIRIKNAPVWTSDFGGQGEMAEATAVIGVTDGIVNDLIAYSRNSNVMADEGFRQALGESFIELGQTAEGKDIISVFSQVGYTLGKDSDYDVTREAEALLKSLTN